MDATQDPQTGQEQTGLLFDENAFGLFVGWFDAEEVELSQSADKFPPRIVVFRAAVTDYLQSFELGRDIIAMDFGTCVYLEVADGDHREDPLAWMRSFRAFLAQGDWRTFGARTLRSRWPPR